MEISRELVVKINFILIFPHKLLVFDEKYLHTFLLVNFSSSPYRNKLNI